jgi:hypothetical protein
MRPLDIAVFVAPFLLGDGDQLRALFAKAGVTGSKIPTFDKARSRPSSSSVAR